MRNIYNYGSWPTAGGTLQLAHDVAESVNPSLLRVLYCMG
jgi:hypothetical protein